MRASTDVPEHYGTKFVVSGQHVEVYQYDKHRTRPTGRTTRFDPESTPKEVDEQKKKLRLHDTTTRRRTKIRRILLANPDMCRFFVTITFKDNVKDIGHAYKDFNFFIKRLRYWAHKQGKNRDFKYLVVPERQKRGAVHFHMVCNAPFYWNKGWNPHTNNRKISEILERVWGYGFADIRLIDDPMKVAGYISKYLTKQDEWPPYTRRYKVSRNVLHPISYYAEPVVEKSDFSPHTGKFDAKAIL